MSLLGIPLGFYSIADLKTICLAGCQHSFWHLGKPGFHEPFNNSTPPSSSSRKPATKQQLLSSRYCVTDHHGSEDPSRRKKNFEAGKTLWATAPQAPALAKSCCTHCTAHTQGSQRQGGRQEFAFGTSRSAAPVLWVRCRPRCSPTRDACPATRPRPRSCVHSIV